jgi:hypothetical protein
VVVLLAVIVLRPLRANQIRRTRAVPMRTAGSV